MVMMVDLAINKRSTRAKTGAKIASLTTNFFCVLIQLTNWGGHRRFKPGIMIVVCVYSVAVDVVRFVLFQ